MNVEERLGEDRERHYLFIQIFNVNSSNHDQMDIQTLSHSD